MSCLCLKLRAGDYTAVDDSEVSISSLALKHSLLGKIQRFQGKFHEALHQLDIPLNIVDRYKSQNHGLYFNEDIHDLACNYADTLRELGFFEQAEKYLRLRIDAASVASVAPASRFVIEASLAECLFAKGHRKVREAQDEVALGACSALEEARELCLQLQSQKSLLRFERLRTLLTLAKISFVQGDYSEAEGFLSKSTNLMSKFDRTNGYATMAIIKTMIETLQRSPVKDDWEIKQRSIQQSREKLNMLKTSANEGGIRY
ncbi:and nb-arc domain protein [Colletotrichum incanum]|uniref:And nb-arc domain protein n=1 Tax=Colletotrichum incanum TaxID=1573173 RepID=A0A167CQL2_COLIC|nr:and nb-arc domain protein [Colletotrichum incanum]